MTALQARTKLLMQMGALALTLTFVAADFLWESNPLGEKKNNRILIQINKEKKRKREKEKKRKREKEKKRKREKEKKRKRLCFSQCRAASR
jgi:hypothetical protein